MTDTIALFEAKAHLSELVRRVAASGQAVDLTVRGIPLVRIIPYESATTKADAWEVRERVVAEYGLPDFAAPPRRLEAAANPFTVEDR